MSIKTPIDCKILAPLPQTPARRVVDEPNSAVSISSSRTLSSITATSLWANRHDLHPTIPLLHPFVAHARCGQSDSGASRYQLTFATAAVANHWWSLMQQEYPESGRDSAQSYHFKNDRIPIKAYENPRISHLKDKWAFKPMDDKENHDMGGKSADRSARPSKRESLRRMLSTPVLRTIGEMPNPQGRVVLSPQRLPEDPFTVPTPPQSVEPEIDFVELNRMLERMQMMMNQTQLRIDVLAERQQMYVEGMERMQSALEANSTHIQALATQHQLGELAMKNVRSAVEQNANHVRIMLDKSINEADRSLHSESKLQHCTQRIDEVIEVQRNNRHELRDVKTTVGQTADRMQTLLDRQATSDEKLDSISTAIGRLAAPQPAVNLDSMQTAIAQQSSQIAALAAAQKSTTRHISKMTPTMTESLSTTLDTLVEQRITTLQSAHQKQLKQLKRDMTTIMTEKLATMAEAQAAQHDAFIAQLAVMKLSAKCDHDVAPPPRKMNRELAGYWYKRT